MARHNQFRHGYAVGGRHPLYRVWANMWTRCSNPNAINYHLYGGRGICVCERWRDFVLFFADVGERPSPQHSLDRINNDGNYEPGNVRWSLRTEQGRNRRTNHTLTFAGKTMCIKDWGAATGLTYQAIRWRLSRGWSVERALTSPHTPGYPRYRAEKLVKVES